MAPIESMSVNILSSRLVWYLPSTCKNFTSIVHSVGNDITLAVTALLQLLEMSSRTEGRGVGRLLDLQIVCGKLLNENNSLRNVMVEPVLCILCVVQFLYNTANI